MHTELWAWPQWTMATILGMNVLIALFMDGTPKSDSKFSVGQTAVNAGISVFILWQGGFFR